MHLQQNMSNLSFENITAWSPEKVTSWMKGLDDLIQPYANLFAENGISGKQLLVLDHLVLDQMGITKLGHQELILESVDHLCQLEFSIEQETVQSIALKLCCQARCIKNELLSLSRTADITLCNTFVKTRPLPVSVVSATAGLVVHLKNLISWMDRPPFEGSDEYKRKRNDFVKQGHDLINTVQSITPRTEDLNARRNEAMRQGQDNKTLQSDTTYEDVIMKCENLQRRCEQIMHESRDSLTIQPAWFELATIRKKAGEELGINIQSSYNGTHTIGRINADSPADSCSKIGKGDEVIQVNYQTVIGWQLKKLVGALKEDPKEVTLLLKRRPCHHDPFGPNHRKQKANRLAAQSGTFPIKQKKSHRSRKGRTQLEQLVSTTPVDTSNFIDGGKEAESESDALDDNVFRSGSESPAPFMATLRAYEDAKQRRATVSGGSPLERPSIMISDSDTPRPKSYMLPLHNMDSGENYNFDLIFDPSVISPDVVSPSVESGDWSKSNQSKQEKHTDGHTSPEGTNKSSSKSPHTSVSSGDSVFTSRTTDKSNLDTTDSSLNALDSSIEASFDHVDGSECQAKDDVTDKISKTPNQETQPSTQHDSRQKTVMTVEKTVITSTKSLPANAAAYAHSKELRSPDKQRSRAIKDYRRTSSKTNQPPSPLRQISVTKQTTTITQQNASTQAQPSASADYVASQSKGNSATTSSEQTEQKPVSNVETVPGMTSSKPVLSRNQSEESSTDTATEKASSNLINENQSKVSIEENVPSQDSVKNKNTDPLQGKVSKSGVNLNQQQRKRSTPTNMYHSYTMPTAASSENAANQSGSRSLPGAYRIRGAVPKEVTRLSPARAESPRRRKASEQASKSTKKKKVIAGGRPEQNTPTLVKVSRINSMMRAQISQQEKREREELQEPALVRSALSPPEEDNRPLSMVSTYAVNIVGGVPQIQRHAHNLPSKDSAMTQSTQSILRKKDRSAGRRRIFGGNRRISCKDLGNGDCQGWLLKRKESSGVLSHKWTKHWFVLKGSDMYYYKTQEDERARGLIHLPGFQIKPAPEIKKKFAFKAEHTGTTFYFASDRQEDMAKWMSMMGLSSILVNPADRQNQGAFHKPDRTNLSNIIESDAAPYSESEGEDESESSSSFNSRTPSKEDLNSDDNIERVYVHLQRENVEPLRNMDIRKNRISHIVTEAKLPDPEQVAKLRRLTSLQRTLKDKEQELEVIEEVLKGKLPLEQYAREHGPQDKVIVEESSSGSDSHSEGEAGAAGTS